MTTIRSDDTASVARAAGAVVATERSQGKGNVVRRMFADIDADIYVMVDGDNTYDLEAAPALIAAMREQTLDFVNGARIDTQASAYRAGHRFGNRLLSGLVQRIFGHQFSDMLSGYKIFSRRFVKSFPAESQGFEIETELTIHALELRMPCSEMPTAYGVRPGGLVEQAQHLARRPAHPVPDLAAGEGRASVPGVRDDCARLCAGEPVVRRSGGARVRWPPASCRACRRQCWRPA